MKNIELFDAYTGHLLKRLYENFPRCIEVKPDDEIATIRASSGGALIESFDDEESRIIFAETVLWLTRNGFIEYRDSEPSTRRPYEPMPYRVFYCVELTIDGLNLLTSPKPKALKGKRVGDAIVEHVKKGAFVEAGKIATQTMFAYAVKKIDTAAQE